MTLKTAAAQLTGLTLDTGWKVVEQLLPGKNSTGGVFSESYKVVQGDRVGFLKAFDFSHAFAPDAETMELLQSLTSAYEHERSVLRHCSERKLSKVVLALEHGSVQVPNLGQMEGKVFYLIFEMADGDIRRQMDTTRSFDVQWAMRALKDISLGLWQVHREMIAHQDAKPSNVLMYGNQGFKLADFGRSSRRGHPVAHDGEKVAGDKSYAPPELLYGYMHADFMPRRFGCDLYMLGNLAAFMFSGRNMTSMVFAELDPVHRPDKWGGTYEEALPYLQAAFTRVLTQVAPLIDESVRADMISILTQLCTPDLARRGHPRGVGKPNQYSLERYVSLLDVLSRKVDYQCLRRKAS